MKWMRGVTIRKISDKRAKQEIGGFFARNLSKGVTRLDVSHVSIGLKIPGTQVEKIFHEFIEEGRVKRV